MSTLAQAAKRDLLTCEQTKQTSSDNPDQNQAVSSADRAAFDMVRFIAELGMPTEREGALAAIEAARQPM